MTRLSIEFVISALTLKKDSNKEPLIFSIEEVVQYGRYLEAATGRAVLNGFSPNSVKTFFNYSDLFKEYYSPNHDKFELKTDALRYLPEWPYIPGCVLTYTDPPLNIPMEVIKASGLLQVLERP